MAHLGQVMEGMRGSYPALGPDARRHRRTSGRRFREGTCPHTTTQRINTSGPQPLTLAVPGQRPTPPKTEAQRRRDHLDRLLGVRSQLARLVAERRSHRMDDETDVFSQQLAVEGAIRDLDGTYGERWPSWVEADVVLEHEPTTMVSWCSLCRIESVAA